MKQDIQILTASIAVVLIGYILYTYKPKTKPEKSE